MSGHHRPPNTKAIIVSKTHSTHANPAQWGWHGRDQSSCRGDGNPQPLAKAQAPTQLLCPYGHSSRWWAGESCSSPESAIKGRICANTNLFGVQVPKDPHVWAFPSSCPSLPPRQDQDPPKPTCRQCYVLPDSVRVTTSAPSGHVGERQTSTQKASDCPFHVTGLLSHISLSLSSGTRRNLIKVLCTDCTSVVTCHSHHSSWAKKQRLYGSRWVRKLIHFLWLKLIWEETWNSGKGAWAETSEYFSQLQHCFTRRLWADVCI